MGCSKCVCSTVLYRLYVSEDSYISVKAQSSVRAQHLLSLVADRLDCLQEDMVLAAVTYAGGKDMDSETSQ